MATIAIDFDGTLHPYTRGWLGTAVVDIEPPDPDLEFVLADLRGRGPGGDANRLVVFSARAADEAGRVAIAEWLIANDLFKYFKGGITHEKPAAVVYLDDRAIRFEGNWFASRDAILVEIEKVNRG